jgi:hypothetical protein
MSNANFLNKERWEQQRHTTVSAKLSRIIDLLEILVENTQNPIYTKAVKEEDGRDD